MFVDVTRGARGDFRENLKRSGVAFGCNDLKKLRLEKSIL